MESLGSKSKEGGQDQTLWCCGPLEEFCCVADVDKVVYRTDWGSRKSGACLELREKGPGDGNSKGCFFLFHCVCEKKARMRMLSRVPVAGPWCEWKMKLQEGVTSGDILREFQTEPWQYKV